MTLNSWSSPLVYPYTQINRFVGGLREFDASRKRSWDLPAIENPTGRLKQARRRNHRLKKFYSHGLSFELSKVGLYDVNHLVRVDVVSREDWVKDFLADFLFYDQKGCEVREVNELLGSYAATAASQRAPLHSSALSLRASSITNSKTQSAAKALHHLGLRMWFGKGGNIRPIVYEFHA